jgi:beta-glucosidase
MHGRRFAIAVMTALILCFLAVAGQAQFPGMGAGAPKGPWMDKTLSPDARADLVLKQMTLDEKIQMLHGMGWMALMMPATSGPGVRAVSMMGFIPGVPRLGVPDLQMSDSVHGISGSSNYATALPNAVAKAASWDTMLVGEVGTLLGHELRAHGFNMSLGSGINLTREPRCGRTFEYEGEDPILAGTLVGAELKAEQATGMMTDVKHYVVNDQDDGRMFVNSVIDMRSLRESDLLAFEIALRDSGAGAVMCSYNKINGTYSCENEVTLNHILKGDLEFKGFVVSDWGGTHSTVKAAMAGLDVEMPGDMFYGAALKKAVEAGDVPQARLDDMVHRILRTQFAAGIFDHPPEKMPVDVYKGFEVAQKLEEKGAVLLKNENRQLPLRAAALKSIAVIGGHANVGVLSGGGSSQVTPAGGSPVPPRKEEASLLFGQTYYHRSVPLKGIEAMAKGAKVTFDEGDDPAKAAALAKGADVAIVFAVQHESEGYDVPNLSLPEQQDALIEAVAAANPHTVVVLETGGPVLMPWLGKVPAVLEAWYPGIRGSEAIANILFGEVNPSGRLPLTFPKSEADLPHPKLNSQPPPAGGPKPVAVGDIPAFPGFNMNGALFDANYDEGLKVGYKWYDAENKEPLFPFGFGLSYTTFGFSGLKAEYGDGLNVSFTVKNTGAVAGEEVAQVYAALPASAGEPPRRLVGWNKVALEPGEEKRVTVHVEPLFLSVFNVDKDKWEVPAGKFKVSVGASSRHLPLATTVKIER